MVCRREAGLLATSEVDQVGLLIRISYYIVRQGSIANINTLACSV